MAKARIDKISCEILNVVEYFDYFKYCVSAKEIQTYISIKITAKFLKIKLIRLMKNKLIDIIDGKYTLGGHGKIHNGQSHRAQISQKKINNVKWFINLLAIFPQIQLIGLSGGVSMMNACDGDDIDVFVISKPKKMWTSRLIILTLSSLFNLRRSRADKNYKNKLCFNLFFDESNLSIPKNKQNLYVAHELVQMRPLIIKGDIYQKLLSSNLWIKKHFPNYKILKYPHHKESKDIFNNQIESLAKNIQMYYINKHRTTEIISDTQLWFFPHDFQNKMKKYI